jgi:hypothetical protein
MIMKNIATLNTNCRICKSPNSEEIMNFGNLALTGVFEVDGRSVTRAPMSLCRCIDCGLVQLAHNYKTEYLYGETYGYESHLNKSMVDHLQRKARLLEELYLSVPGGRRKTVVDIASNDGTLLSGYVSEELDLVGIDPLISVVGDYYPSSATKITEFFSTSAYESRISTKASLVTSLSVLYDLMDPIQFAQDINKILEEGGIWHFEQSYLPTMVETLSYDTICHEHLLYLSMHDIQNLLAASGFTIISVSLNSINGGSIAVTASKNSESAKQEPPPFVSYLLKNEFKNGYQDGSALRRFAKDAEIHRNELNELIKAYLEYGFSIFGLGASTKGNVLLQWLQLESGQIEAIGDINPRKFGRQTPGTGIEIVSEESLIEKFGKNSIALVLPWHFRDGIVQNLGEYLGRGGNLLFPLPKIQIV